MADTRIEVLLSRQERHVAIAKCLPESCFRQVLLSASGAEKVLWYWLRNRALNGYKFRRQVPVGSYIADFVCIEMRLIVEVGGGQPAEQVAYDRERGRFLRNEGYVIERYWNNEVLGNLEGVLETLTLARKEYAGGFPAASQRSFRSPSGRGNWRRSIEMARPA